MSLLERVQAIVPEAQSLAEAISIRREQERGIRGRIADITDREKKLAVVLEYNKIALEYIRLMHLEKELYQLSESVCLAPVKQEATA